MILSLPKFYRSALILFVLGQTVLFAREFTDQSGNSLSGEVLEFRGREVVFRRSLDNKEFLIPIEIFSKNDQAWIRSEIPLSRTQNLSETKINQYVERLNAAVDRIQQLTGAEKSQTVDDSTFVRRIYLKLAGRVPLPDEARAFLDNRSPNKRSELIDQIIGSPAYLSSEFNYWADLLRVHSHTVGEGTQEGVLYAKWIKEELAKNTPYDEWISSMITAEGTLQSNPAVGYYLRDKGMPLDNLANTIQTFLGTQMQCAQCHNHPFDRWTQRDFFELAAFRYQINTKKRNSKHLPKLEKAIAHVRDIDDVYQKLVNRTILSLRGIMHKVEHGNRPLKLPKSYNYADGKPGDVVQPSFIFNDGQKEVNLPRSKYTDHFTDWLVSPDNPRFTKVIANRMWKRAIGVGVFEPLDNLKDDTVIKHPDLINLLSEIVLATSYNLQAINRIIYRAEIMEKQAVDYDMYQEEDFTYTGPVIRRITAEQWWDSLMIQFDRQVDTTVGLEYKNDTEGQRWTKLIEQSTQGELNAYLERIVRLRDQQFNARKNKKGEALTRKEQKELTELTRVKMFAEGKILNRFQKQKAVAVEKVRASELPSPAPEGHYLNSFGQADRLAIESATSEGSVPQVLAMMNSPLINDFLMSSSDLSRELTEIKKTRDQLEHIYLSFLSRYPTEEENQRLLNLLRGDNNSGKENIIWAIINSKEFLYVL